MARPRPQSESRGTIVSWRTPADVGAFLFLAWFLVLLVRPQLVRRLQSMLLANRQLIPMLPYGIATPRVVVATVSWVGIPLVTLTLFVSLLFASPRTERESEPSE